MNGIIKIFFSPSIEKSIVPFSFKAQYVNNQIGKIECFDNFSGTYQVLDNMQSMFNKIEKNNSYLKNSTLSCSISIYNVKNEREVFLRTNGYWDGKPIQKTYLDSVICYQRKGMLNPLTAIGVIEKNNLSHELSKEHLDPIKDKSLIDDVKNIEQAIGYLFNKCKLYTI